MTNEEIDIKLDMLTGKHVHDFEWKNALWAREKVCAGDGNYSGTGEIKWGHVNHAM